MGTTTVKAGDTKTISWDINDDLTGATARLLCRAYDATTAVELPHDVEPGATSRISHTLTGTLAPGTYFVEVEYTRAGVKVTAPTQGYELLVVEPDLG